jgi:hypothetical protein
MYSLRAQDHGGTYAERLALEGGKRFANSIRSFCETALAKIISVIVTFGEAVILGH